MAGVLQFTLGLEASKFIGEIQHAASELAHFFIEGVEGAFETGARLEHLSKRTGVAVSELFGLEKAFKAAGLSGDAVSTILFQMQKSLGGFSEFGTPTKDIFASMGLDVDKLKAAKPSEALMEITTALGQLGNAEATKAGSLIFGRGGAADALQFARSMDLAEEAMRKSATTGALFERNAEAFAKIERTVEQVKNKSKGLFAGVAEGAAPGVQAVLDMLNKIDLKNIGQEIGTTIGALGNALSEGGLSEAGNILKLSIQVGAEKALNFIVATLGNPSLWNAIWQVAVGGLGILGTVIIKTVLNAFASLDKGIAKFLGFDSDKVDKAFRTDGIFKALGLDDNVETGKGFMMDGLKELAPALKAGTDAASVTSPAGQELAALLDKFKLTFEPAEHAEAKKMLADVTADKLDKGKAPHQQNADTLTRMGFFAGGGNLQAEHIRQTATHTRQTVGVLNNIHKVLTDRGVGGNDFSNIA